MAMKWMLLIIRLLLQGIVVRQINVQPAVLPGTSYLQQRAAALRMSLRPTIKRRNNRVILDDKALSLFCLIVQIEIDTPNISTRESWFECGAESREMMMILLHVGRARLAVAPARL